MAAFVRFEIFSEDLAKKKHDLHADTLKVMLTNTTPNVATHAVKLDLTDIAAVNGYPAGGVDTQNTVTRAGAVSSVTGTDIVFTASGGSIGPFRYAALYNDTQTAPVKPLIGYWDYGSALTLLDTETFTVDFGTSQLTIG
jgi:hypothetical protein